MLLSLESRAREVFECANLDAAFPLKKDIYSLYAGALIKIELKMVRFLFS